MSKLMRHFALLVCAASACVPALAGIVVINDEGAIDPMTRSKKYSSVSFEGVNILFGNLVAWPRSGVLISNIHEGEVEDKDAGPGPVNAIWIDWRTDDMSADCRINFVKSKGESWAKSQLASARSVKYDAALEWSYAALRGSTISRGYPFFASRLMADWLVLTGVIQRKFTRQGDVAIAYFSFRGRGERESYHYYAALSKDVKVQGSCRLRGPYDDETIPRLLGGIEWHL